MTAVPTRPLEIASAWTGRERAQRRDWIHELSPAEADALDRAVARARAGGKPLADLTRADFPLGELGRSVEAWLDALDVGLGFVLVRGVPVERYGDEGAIRDSQRHAEAPRLSRAQREVTDLIDALAADRSDAVAAGAAAASD